MSARSAAPPTSGTRPFPVEYKRCLGQASLGQTRPGQGGLGWSRSGWFGPDQTPPQLGSGQARPGQPLDVCKAP